MKIVTDLINRIKQHIADPHHINRDWADFKSMDKAQLKAEFERLLFESKRVERSADRFRRLCQHIACHWVYDERENWD
jgi:hypothetical protein